MARPGAGGALLRSLRVLSQLPPAARGASPLGLRGAAAAAAASASYGTSITSAKIKVNGVPLHYKQTGQGDHAVLLLPGMLGSSQTDFGPQLKSMNKQLFTIVAWDPRGYGHSIPPARDFPPDFFERDARDAVDLMQALKFKNFSMLGWSDGGITALIAAAKYPTLIHKLVVWGANAVVTQEDLKLYNGNICQHLLPHIKCPTFIIHGGKDPLVPQFHAEYLHKHIKESRLLLMPEGKHNLHLRFAEEFNRLVEDFLQ
ncbi:serine hydrolase BPHL isoform X2 [Chelonoidis abingdonii]|uniref:serine hydrolase BPHL isoform X2 n=1 Tax=Chelonoidis abingdonii TaxID=106734 RepID=UPI0013F2549D|nr:valacyclovir hydrolase isoform X2 [Chelonoidis abingdonii]